ncbi:MAG: tetratricopeptide repeat protein [Oscillospiraceae bacterium]|nr:tetratricopeptide repeat protein [Oscillospiraceae bacterium]
MEVPIFIASSIREFQMERLLLSPFIEMLNGIYKRMDAQIVWNRPETQFGVVTMGGSQKTLDEFIDECAVFVLIVGEKAGEYTEGEFQRALGRFRRTDGKEPIILPCFLKSGLSEESGAFLKRVRALDIGQQYIEPYDNFDAALNRLQMVLADYIVNHAPQSDAETDLKVARERIIEKIRDLQADIGKLQDAPPSQETIAKITLAYAEIWRLAKNYKVVEPDALLDYMGFLWEQHQYDTGIEVGHWLEGFYQMENPSDYKLSLLKNRLGLCYADNNQHKQAEKYYREELEINRRLAAENPAFENIVALTCNNLACLLDDVNRKEEAEKYYREALEIRRRLAKANPASFEPYVATVCNNLAVLLKNTNRMEEAEEYYGEALEIRRRLAKANPAAFEPYVAMTCDNLGIFYATINQMEKAEEYFREALEIDRWLAESNPAAYLPDLAQTYHNLGHFKQLRGNRDAARRYFEEALSIYEKFPHLVKNAQDDRERLAALRDA